MDFSLSQLASILPAEIEFLSMLKFIGLFILISMIAGLLGRLLFGKRSNLNHAISSAMAILFIYVLSIVVYTFNPAGLSRYLSPLPFVHFSENYLYLFPFNEANIAGICSDALSLVILSFLVNLLDSFIPKGKSVTSWYLLRFLSILLAIGLHGSVSWALHTLLPGVLVTYAPIILLGILIIMLFLGVLNVLLGLVLTVVNPILGGIYAFFFSNILGKQLSKSILTSAMICGTFYFLSHFGYRLICISATALLSYFPLLIVLLVLWYLIGHLL